MLPVFTQEICHRPTINDGFISFYILYAKPQPDLNLTVVAMYRYCVRNKLKDTLQAGCGAEQLLLGK